MKQKIKDIFIRIIPFVMTIISYLFIRTILVNKYYGFIPTILFIILLVLFYNNDYKNKIMKKEILILSCFFAVLLSYGDLLNNNLLSFSNTFKDFFKINNLINTVAYFNLFYILLNLVIPKLYKLKPKINKPDKNNYILVFSISFAIILLCWMPYCMRFFPGMATNDSIDVIDIIVNNFKGINNHHPVFFILFAYIPIMIGKVKFHSVAIGIAIYTLIQMFILISIYSGSIVFLYKRKVPKFILAILILVYALVPLYPLYAVTMWKDVIFAGLFVMLIMQMIKMVERYSKNELTFKKQIGFIVIALFFALFRNNAIYMLIIVGFISIFIFKKTRKVIALSFGIILLSYFVITGPGYKLFKIKQTEATEYIAIPLQQVARIVYKGVPLTLEEEKNINKLIPIKILKQKYRPQIVDPIKFNSNFNEKELSNHKGRYLKLWLGLCLRHPNIALEAQAAATLGYWYPNIIYWFNPEALVNTKYDNDITPKSSELLSKRVDKNVRSDTPIYNIEWNIAIWLYVIIIFGVISFKKNKWLGIVPYLPVFGLWFTLIIATPVYAEYRYIYGAFTSLPLLIVYPYLKK